MKVSELKKIAVEKKIGEERLAEADDAKDIKGFLATFILEAEYDTNKHRLLELMEMKVSELKKKAVGWKIPQEKLDEADDGENVREVLSALILQAERDSSTKVNETISSRPLVCFYGWVVVGDQSAPSQCKLL